MDSVVCAVVPENTAPVLPRITATPRAEVLKEVRRTSRLGSLLRFTISYFLILLLCASLSRLIQYVFVVFLFAIKTADFMTDLTAAFTIYIPCTLWFVTFKLFLYTGGLGWWCYSILF